MIMSVHDPIARKRLLADGSSSSSKKSRPNDDTAFSEKMYSAYIKSALEGLDKVCIVMGCLLGETLGDGIVSDFGAIRGRETNKMDMATTVVRNHLALG